MTSATLEPVKAKSTSNMKADRLVLVNLSAQPCEAWLDAVRKAGQPWHGEVLSDLDKAKLILKEQPLAHVLISYEAPERQIAACIAKETLPSQALANWMNACEALLALYRDNFQRMTLIRREALEHSAKELFALLAARSGIALGRVAVKAPVAAEAADAHQEAIHCLLASQALQHSSVQSLSKELEASTLPLREADTTLDLVDDSYSVLQEGLSKKPDLPVEEYELLIKAKDKLVSENADLAQRLEEQLKHNGEISLLQERLHDAQKENDLLIEQLHKVQHELERYALDERRVKHKLVKLQHDIDRKNEKLHGFSQKNKRLSAQLREIRRQLKDVRQSKSWKITAPLRKSIKALGAGKSGKS